jgi:hypothetical protein
MVAVGTGIGAPGTGGIERMGSYVPPRMQNIVSQFATTSVPQLQSPEQKQPNRNMVDRVTGLPVTDIALEVGQSGVPFLGPWGYLAGLPISTLVADKEAKKKLTQLTEDYRADIAQQLNIPEEAVNEQMVFIAAHNNPGLQQAINAISDKKDKHLYVNGSAIAGMAGSMTAAYGLGVLGTAAMFTGIPGLLVGGGIAMAGALAGERFGSQFFDSKDDYNPMTHIDKLEQKRQQHEPIKAEDIFALRVAQNPTLNQAVKEQYGTSYFNLDSGQQLQVMQMSDGLMQRCFRDAEKAARPETNVKALMFGMLPESPFAGMYQPVQTYVPYAPAVPAQGYWQDRVGGPQSQRGSFIERVQAKAAMAQQQQTQLS